MYSRGDMAPDSPLVIAVYVTAINEKGIRGCACLGIQTIAGSCNEAGAFDQCDASGIRVDGKLGLAICVQFSTRDRAEPFFWKKNNLSEGIGSCPWWFDGDA